MKTPEKMAYAVVKMTIALGNEEKPQELAHALIALLTAWAKEIEDEAYDRGYNNGYARQKHDADWDKAEANL